MKTGIELIAQERKSQIEKHGLTAEVDAAKNANRQLIEAISLMLPEGDEQDNKIYLKARLDGIPTGWSPRVWEKMAKKSYLERLVMAGAMLAAEIDRINHSENI